MSQISESSELFSNCDEEVTTLYTQEDKIFALKEAQNCIDSANENLKQMEIELQGFDTRIKENLKQQFQLQKRKLDEMRKIYNQMRSSQENILGKEQLFGGDHQRQKLLREQEKLYDQNLKLHEAKMISYGIEKEANQIQLNLHRNNEILARDIEKQQGIRNDLGDSFGLIKIMQNRIRDNRLVFYVVGGIVLTALLITIYMHI